MDFNLIGRFWRWPVNLSGNATGNDMAIIRPSFDANISNLNILKDTNISNFNINFSGEATANDLMELIGMALILIPANQRADLDPIDAFGKRIEKVMKAISASIYTFEDEKSGISFNELDKSTEELKASIQKFIDKLLEEIDPKPKEKEIIKSGGNP